jgi:hypothetical protein
VLLQVMNQLVHFRRLAKALILTLLSRDTHAPALLVDIQTDVNRLTRKINSATLNIIHGKPPFGEFLCGNKNYSRNRETCLSFLIALFENYVGAFLRVIHMGVESGEILAQRHSGGAGRPEGQNLGALVAPCG